MTVGGPIGVLGGTFDPVHYGHLAIAEDARESLGLDRILFVPAGIPPHKGDRQVTQAAARVAMVELAIADNPAFSLSRVEVDRPGPSYAVDTIDLLRVDAEGHGRSPMITFIMSVEAMIDLPTWHEPERLLSLCRVAVAPRPGVSVDPRRWMVEHYPDRIDRLDVLDGPHLGHAASDIRARIGLGRSIRYHVPPAVRAYIDEHQLYRLPPGRIPSP